MNESGLPDVVSEVKVGRPVVPQRTFFYERRDGSIIAMSEEEAGLTGKFFRLLGVSDGQEYSRRITEIQKNLANLSVEDVHRLTKEAFQAELDIAKQTVERPRDMNKTGLEGESLRGNKLEKLLNF
jgi:hypothetical protein